MHEVTSPQAFEGLRDTGRKVRRPDLTLAVADHNVPTDEPRARASPIRNRASRSRTLETNAREFGIEYLAMDDIRQGIVHIVGPEQGWTLPGTTIVCGDCHTSTHGAFGALAFGIGTSEVEHVLATQTLADRQHSKNMRVNVNGTLPIGVTAKDIALAIIAQDRHRGRHRLCHRICRRRGACALDGRPHDPLQHDDRGAARAPA